MTRAIVVGAGGQDGRILCKRLQREGSEVVGISRDSARSTGSAAPVQVDIQDFAQVSAFIAAWRPDHIYYLAAHHHSSQDSTGEPLELYAKSHAVHVLGLVHFLESMRLHAPAARLFYASSCLIFGHPLEAPQDERTTAEPRCIYGVTKLAGMQMCRLYRETHRVFASSGILYNHESRHRPERFVSRKIVSAARRIAAGSQEQLVLGDLSAQVDWGFAPDFVDAMCRILSLDKPNDFIVATGEAHSVQEFVEIAFGALGLDWKAHVRENPAVLQQKRRNLVGDFSKLHSATGWRPSITFRQMVESLVHNAPESV
jgi:GDPmannose 4,6-dehydratase